MSDLELTKLCARAIGYTHTEENGDSLTLRPTYQQTKAGLGTVARYRPLENDKQAMALMKKLRLCVGSVGGWSVWSGIEESEAATSQDLNRAIVECVAKMQQGAASV